MSDEIEELIVRQDEVESVEISLICRMHGTGWRNLLENASEALVQCF